MSPTERPSRMDTCESANWSSGSARSTSRSSDEHGCALHAVGCQIAQCDVGLVQRVAAGHHVEVVFGGEAQKIAPVLTGIGSDAADLPFAEQMPLVIQHGDVGEVDTGQRQGAA